MSLRNRPKDEERENAQYPITKMNNVLFSKTKICNDYKHLSRNRKIS